MSQRSPDELEARAQFAAQENVFHEHLAALNREFTEARDRGLSPEQWRTGLGHFAELCAAVATFRSRWHSLTRPDARGAREYQPPRRG